MSPISDDEIRSFIDRLEAFVIDEREHNRAQIHGIWALPLANRIQKGYAVDNLTVTEIEALPNGRWSIALSCREDHSRFREGDAVRISTGQPDDPESVRAEGRIFSSDDRELIVVAKYQRLHIGQTSLVLDANIVDLSERYLTALRATAATHHGRSRVIPLLLNRIEPRFTRGCCDGRALAAEGFTERQIEALERCVGTDLCYLVQGPPGTGKTRVLAKLVALLLDRQPDATILVTSFTHRAIENALIAVLRAGVPPNIVFKVGDKMHDATIAHVIDDAGLPPGAANGPVVIGATPFALSTRLAKLEFDWVIVDEASQVTLPLAIMAMIRANRWIFFGDDQQLPPVVQSLTSREAIRQSAFGCLSENNYFTRLSTTFRLPPELARWPAHEFYEDDLTSAAKQLGAACDSPAFRRT